MQRGEDWRNDDPYRSSRAGSRRDLDEGWERESWRGGLRGTRREPYEGRFDRGPNEMMSRPEESEAREARGYGGAHGEHEGYGPYGRHPASSYRDDDFGRGPGYERSEGARYGRGSWNPEPRFERERESRYYGDTGRRPAEGSRQGYRYLGEGTFRAGSSGMEGERWDRSGSEWAGVAQGYGRTGQRPTTGSTRTRRGPKGYTRSDERIREDVCDRLSDSDLNCDEVEVNVKDGEVILTGTTDSGGTRREIERVTETVSGVKDVTNQIRMRREASSSTGDGRKSNQGSNADGSSTRRENAKSV